MIVKSWNGHKLHILYKDSEWLILLQDLEFLGLDKGDVYSKIRYDLWFYEWIKDEDDLDDGLYTFVSIKGMYQGLLASKSSVMATMFQDYVFALINLSIFGPNWDDGLAFFNFLESLGKSARKPKTNKP